MLSITYTIPLQNIALSHAYPSLEAARQSLRLAGKAIKDNSLPRDLHPLLLLFTGSGNVSQGAQEMARELQAQFITAAEIPKLKQESGLSF